MWAEWWEGRDLTTAWAMAIERRLMVGSLGGVRLDEEGFDDSEEM
jgi:hypothetical protein